MKRMIAAACILAVCSGAGAQWADDIGSAYQKADKNISVGTSFFPIGFYGGFDYAFHEAISGGGAVGFNVWPHPYYRDYFVPILGRAAFHPFNLAVIADKVPARDRLDPYVGFSVGGRINWWRWKDGYGSSYGGGSSARGFVLREWIGVRWYITDQLAVFAEDCAGLGYLNAGLTLRL